MHDQAAEQLVRAFLPNPFIIENAVNTDVRDELVERVLRSLSADGERGEGQLLRRDVDRTYLRRNLTISECACVETKLKIAGFRIVDEDSRDDDFSAPEAKNSKYLSELDERELGRKIQLAKRIGMDGESQLSDFDRRVLADAAKAKKRFIETNLRYVHKLAAQKRHLKHFVHEDVVQEGLIGLLKATDLFDPELGFRFKTYATWWIQQQIHRALDDGERTVRLPVHMQENIRRIRRKSQKLALELGREPTIDQLATSLGVEKEKLAKLLWRVHATDCAEADAPIAEDTTLLTFVADETPDSFDVVSMQDLRKLLGKILRRLTPREERIIRLRFGLDGLGSQTLETIGIGFGVTRERIRQIEAKALRKLKHPSRSRDLRVYLDD